MADLPDSDAVADDEVILRRIPRSKSWYNPATKQLEDEAFAPLRNDKDGISVSRRRSDGNPSFLTDAQVGISGLSKSGYFVAALRVRDVRRLGLSVIPDPIPPGNPDGLPENPGHALIPELNYADKETDAVQEWMVRLADGSCVEEVSGPYGVGGP